MFEIRKEQMDELSRELSYMKEDLEILIKDNPEDLPKVLEEDFITYLLPYIIDKVERNVDNDKIFFNNWMKLIGDVVVPFYVVDEDGGILYKVPKYLSNLDDINTPISDVSYSTILKTYEEEYKNLPEKANKILSESIDTLEDMSRINPVDLLEVINFIKYIKNRYNIKDEDKKEEELEEFDIDYED